MGRGGGRLSRRPPRETPRLKITLFCEGEVTEPAYLRHIAAEVRIKLDIRRAGGKPAELVEAAIAARRAAKGEGFAGAHEIWVVFDCDEHPGVPELRRRAEASDVRVAYSEPCFEVWALLHMVEGLGPMTSAQAVERVCERFPGYRRAKLLDYDAIRPHHEDAVIRAGRLRAAREQDGATNPYTDVDVLVELIRENGRP
ncbi:RloB family protein [Salinarimonas chemoclinalis]|uniref:RloB family protein n=1 Tax=Salinarimonas chemoclinalis TaxID=3241599 RepID=UPI00355879B4